MSHVFYIGGGGAGLPGLDALEEYCGIDQHNPNMTSLRVVSCPGQDIALLNQIFLNPQDYAMLGGEASADLYIELKGMVYTAKPHEKVEPGAAGLNSLQRRNAAVSNGDQVGVGVFTPSGAEASLLSSASIEADFVVKKAARGTETMDGAALVQNVLTRYSRQYLTVGQQFVADFQGHNLLLKVGPLEALVVDKASGGADGGSVQRGMLNPQTQIQLSRAQGSPIAFTGLESQSRKTIFKQDFSFSEMGIGGLDKEFSDIFRRAFASRASTSTRRLRTTAPTAWCGGCSASQREVSANFCMKSST